MLSATAVEPEASRLASALRAVEELAGSDVPPATFFRSLLAHAVEPLGARAGVVWLLNAEGLLSGECESGLDGLAGDRSWLGGATHLKWLDEALGSDQPVVHAAEGAFAAGTTLVVARFETEGRPAGVVEFFLDGVRSDERDDRLSFVEELAGHASRFLAWRQEADSASRQVEFWASLIELTAQLHRSLRSAEVAATAVNDARTLLGADRVTLAVRHGAGCRVVAISGQDRVNRRANLVRSLEALAGEVLASGQAVAYTGRIDEFPPQVERPLAEYLAHSGSRMVRLVPLFPPGPHPLAPQDESGAAGGRTAFIRRSAETDSRPLGVLVVERLSRSWLTPLDIERGDRVAEHVAGALANAEAHERVFLLPVWRALGAWTSRLRGRRLAAFSVVLLLVGTVVAALFAVPAEYRVEAPGRLMPAARRAVFAPWDGEVVELYVQSEQPVAQGEPLLRLRNDELHAQLLAARNRLEERRKALTALQAELDEVNRRSTAWYEATRLRGRLAQALAEIEGAEDRVHNLEQQVELLTVRAPLAGTVIAFQLEELLLNRPVQRGEVLLEVMDESGPWELELNVPEFRMGHLLDARAATDSAELPVEFVLATRPERRFAGRLRELSTRTGVSEQGVTIVAARAALADPLPDRTIGAEVQARISCGPRSLGYVLFGDVVEFFRRRFW